MQQAYAGYAVFNDVASGLNYKRKGLSRILEQVQAGMVTEVVVAHHERLARFTATWQTGQSSYVIQTCVCVVDVLPYFVLFK